MENANTLPMDTVLILSILTALSPIFKSVFSGIFLERLYPLFIILIAVLLSFFYIGGDRYSVLQGIMIGLSSLGLFTSTKESIDCVKDLTYKEDK